MSTQQLTDITRGMHHAASTTAAMIAQQYIRIIDQFFDVEPDGSMTAKMVKVHIDQQHYMMVPLISLVTPKGLSLEKMRVEMSVKIDEASVRQATDALDNSKATRSSFKVSMAPKSNILGRRSDITDIEMIFTQGDPPEGMMRIIDEYTNMIKPIRNGGGDTVIKSAKGTGDGYDTIGIDPDGKKGNTNIIPKPKDEETDATKDTADNEETDVDMNPQGAEPEPDPQN